MSVLARLRVYRFDPGAVFEGGLLGAIERMELGAEAKLLDALFVRRDATSGALEAVDLAAGGAGGTFASLLDFRLEPGRRRAITERTLAEHSGGVPRPLIEAIAATLEAGAAIFAILYTARAVEILEDAVARSGGAADRRRARRRPRTRAGRPAAARGGRLPHAGRVSARYGLGAAQ